MLIKQHKAEFKFTVVRNPFNRIVSAYYYLIHSNLETDKHLRDQLKCFSDFEDFILRLPALFAHNNNVLNLRHLYPQTNFVTNGDRLLTAYYKYEDGVDVIWSRLLTKMDLPSCKVPRINVTLSYPKIEFSSKMKDIVYRLYEQDFKTFNYDQ